MQIERERGNTYSKKERKIKKYRKGKRERERAREIIREIEREDREKRKRDIQMEGRE